MVYNPPFQKRKRHEREPEDVFFRVRKGKGIPPCELNTKRFGLEAKSELYLSR